ncbi:MAG TPA: hypothetical protein VM432_06520, partial [Bdellovibrionales bacterium]|nr:hypothetical protein [Bdellovibrionales bacterium]
ADATDTSFSSEFPPKSKIVLLMSLCSLESTYESTSHESNPKFLVVEVILFGERSGCLFLNHILFFSCGGLIESLAFPAHGKRQRSSSGLHA